ncbi:DNA repair protein RadA [candidate division WOR-3 bacterium]|nr:DNA repair protein RadA [candidate division WOR-3 bacterium]
MVKNRIKFLCNECGFESTKWLGKCPSCGQWNTFVEYKETRVSKNKFNGFEFSNSIPPQSITEIEKDNLKRSLTGIYEFDRVLGGGIVPGSVVLIGGEPGIGKSTLLMQMAYYIANNGAKVLYSSSEESVQQLSLRANRLDVVNDDLLVCAEYSVDKIIEYCENIKPSLLIVDSIQTIFDADSEAQQGSVNSIKLCASKLIKYAKTSGIPIFIIGHVTKGGIVAGPKILEHMVDSVMYLEGSSNHDFRILRNAKNRFGSTDEIGLFEMSSSGLKEVKDPGEIFLTKGEIDISGSVLGSTIEGSRPIAIEIQAIASETKYGIPQRSINGPDYKRVNTIIAVLEKRLHLFLGNQDIFINAVGGIRINDPGIDLAIFMAIYSSYSNKIIPKNNVFIGEIGLGGEIRAVSGIKRRIEEARRFGINKIFIPYYSREEIKNSGKIIKCKSVNDLVECVKYV